MTYWTDLYHNLINNVGQKFGLSSDSGHVFIFVFLLMIICVIVLIGALIKKIYEKNIYRYLFFGLIAIAGNILLIIMPKNIGLVPIFIGVFLINAIFYFFIKFDMRIKNKHLIDVPERSDDLNLKDNTTLKSLKMIDCPSCNKKTISYYHVLRAPQTCGNCHKKFKINGSELKLILYFSVFILTLAGGIFLLLKKAYSPIAFILMGIGYLNYFLYKIRLMRLKEV